MVLICLCSGRVLLGVRYTGPGSLYGLKPGKSVFVVRYSFGDVSIVVYHWVLQVVGNGILWRLAVRLIAIGCAGFGSVL